MSLYLNLAKVLSCCLLCPVLCFTVFRELSPQRAIWLQGVLHWAPETYRSQWTKKRVALLYRATGKKQKVLQYGAEVTVYLVLTFGEQQQNLNCGWKQLIFSSFLPCTERLPGPGNPLIRLWQYRMVEILKYNWTHPPHLRKSAKMWPMTSVSKTPTDSPCTLASMTRSVIASDSTSRLGYSVSSDCRFRLVQCRKICSLAHSFKLKLLVTRCGLWGTLGHTC